MMKSNAKSAPTVQPDTVDLQDNEILLKDTDRPCEPNATEQVADTPPVSEIAPAEVVELTPTEQSDTAPSVEVAEPIALVEPIPTVQPTPVEIIRKEFHTLGDIAPSLTIDELIRSDGYDAMLSRVKRGYTLRDAYILSCTVLPSVPDGRTHLKATSLYGKTSSSPPSDVARLYRLYMPKSGMGEIEKNYNEYLKSKKERR